jgi:predicted MPP superfamily phosphohydrolase
MKELRRGAFGLKAWSILGLVFVQSLLLLAHLFMYQTWIDFHGSLSLSATLALRVAMLLLAFSFMSAALLGYEFGNKLITLLYRVAAVWLGLLNFFFWASCLCWLSSFVIRLAAGEPNRPLIANVLFGLAMAAGIYSLLNARWIRIRRVSVRLPGLPESWRGRTALLLSDLHLGHVNRAAFSRRIVAMASRLNPDVIFLPGDLFDGAKIDVAALIAPFRQLAPPFGIYFSAGNHDEFGEGHYVELLARAGIRVLHNEKVNLDGLEVVGVPFDDSTYPIRLRATLESLRPPPGQASILLSHVPTRLPIIEQAGFSLLLSGHTHGGQIFPFTWLTRRAFGKFTYGLQEFGDLAVYTSSGASTWGPPMRLGTDSEIVLLSFE